MIAQAARRTLNVAAEPLDVVVTLDGGLVQKSEEMTAPLAAFVAGSAR